MLLTPIHKKGGKKDYEESNVKILLHIKSNKMISMSVHRMYSYKERELKSLLQPTSNKNVSIVLIRLFIGEIRMVIINYNSIV